MVLQGEPNPSKVHLGWMKPFPLRTPQWPLVGAALWPPELAHDASPWVVIQPIGDITMVITEVTSGWAHATTRTTGDTITLPTSMMTNKGVKLLFNQQLSFNGIETSLLVPVYCCLLPLFYGPSSAMIDQLTNISNSFNRSKVPLSVIRCDNPAVRP